MSDTTITVQQAIDRSLLRARDLDKTNDRLTDAQALIYINKAIEYIHQILVDNNSELAIETASVTLIQDTSEYDLSGNLDDFLAMAPHGVYYDDDFLIPITYEDKLREGTTTTDVCPTHYYLTKDKIGFLPTPTEDSVETYTAISCRYFKTPVNLSLSDNMPYKNALNQPITAFMDSMGALAAEKATDGFTALYNALEESTMKIIKRRIPT